MVPVILQEIILYLLSEFAYHSIIPEMITFPSDRFYTVLHFIEFKVEM